MGLFRYRLKKMRPQHQKNLKAILAMEQTELVHWLANLPEEEIQYIEWLIDEVETALDEILLESTHLKDAEKVIRKFTLKK